ncbi:MAG: hypothetical protein EP300_08280, partial [Gammaproteobacteria bacterium]
MLVDVGLRLAWRNLWRHWRRTWLTVGAMIFSNGLLIFAMSLQFGSYDMMIDNSLHAYSGHLQLQHPRYLDEPKMRYALDNVAAIAERLRRELSLDSISARAAGFALASSEERSYGLQIVGVDPVHEPLVSTLPGLVKQGRYLKPGAAGEIVIGAVLARNLKISVGDELTFLGSGFDDSFAAGIVTVVGIFESGMADLDRALAQVELGYFQDVFAMQEPDRSRQKYRRRRVAAGASQGAARIEPGHQSAPLGGIAAGSAPGNPGGHGQQLVHVCRAGGAGRFQRAQHTVDVGARTHPRVWHDDGAGPAAGTTVAPGHAR